MAEYQFFLTPQKVPHISTKHRTIKTKIPTPGTKKLIQELEKIESRSMHGQLPIVWKKASDYNVFDISDNCWIDFTSTIFVANVGHSNPHLIDAIKSQIEAPLISCYAYANPVRAKYIRQLVDFAGKPFEKVFLLSAGTEATEAAFKLMRMHGQKKGKRRCGIICIENNWHGRTLGAQFMSGNSAQQEWIGYQDPDIHHIPFPYPWALNGKSGEEFFADGLKNLTDQGIDIDADVCGFMLETFQGWGAIFYPKSFVQAIENICKRSDLILSFDEMQAGFGRTGKAFGFQHYGVTPDLIAVGKGMGGGVPLAGVLGRAEIMDLPTIGNMSSTHSANPLVCAAGMAVIDELVQTSLVDRAAEMGEVFRLALNSLREQFPDRISWVLGEGMIFALLFSDPVTRLPDPIFASRVAEKCMQKGLLVVHTGRESIKLGPPLNIPKNALLEGVDVLKEAVLELA